MSLLDPMLVYQLIITVCLLAFLGILLWNMRELPSLPEHKPETGAPLVSVLVPARNEENNIKRCITSLLHQDYDNYELIVLNDGSTDRTGEILDTLLRSDGGALLRIIEGKALPPGWHGKAWACDQLGKAAQGELFLFTDADTYHSSDSLSRSVAAMQESGADLLSMTPRQEMRSFWEKLVVPLIYFILLCYLPLKLVPATQAPSLCFANGQFLMFRRRMYKRIGGHAAVCSDLVEDVWLCRAVKRRGGKVMSYNGIETVNCRMYRTFGEVWQGFSKNLFAGLGYHSFGLFFLMLVTALVYIVPYGFVIASATAADFSIVYFWLPFLQVCIALLCRLLIAGRFRQPITGALLHVFSQVVLLGIAVNSFYLVKFGNGSRWKGRRYNFSGKRG
ncbi:glycosyltransferase [Prosthecochloris sp. SCSIO W1101]|uniref:glycosyltransferase n=1 Tax=Prosthecochloris sp. SCSIO W1101 TaxID=2992242 RepID=UPI002AC868BF|nr:glycosyltransferase [Prosthecochloris sp. SCSIO W1101]